MYEYWIEAMERIMDDLDFTPEQKLKGIVSSLGNEAYQCTAQPPKVIQQPLRGCGQARGGNGMGRWQKAPGRGAGQAEARQLTLVYVARRREDRDVPDVITGTFLFLICLTLH